MRLALWTPQPRAAWAEALLPLLRQEADVALVDGEAALTPECDLDLYHVADRPAHGFVYRALRERPGLVLLEDFCLGRLVHAETAGRGHPDAYVAEARREGGSTGAFIARQEIAGRGGETLLSLLPLHLRVLESSLGLVTFADVVRARASRRLPGRPVVHLPLPFVGEPGPLPDRDAARMALRVPGPSPLVAVISAPRSGARRALASVEEREPGLVVRPWPDGDEAARGLLAAADVAVALESPPGSGVPSAVARAVAAGVPTLLSAGTVAAAELPDGVAVHVSPGYGEAAELEAQVRRLVRDASLRARVARLARDHGAARREPAPSAARLLALARDLAPSAALARSRHADALAAEEATVRGRALEAVSEAARALGVFSLPPGLEPLLDPLLRAGR